MLSTQINRKCSKCNHYNIHENLYCDNCMASLIKNKCQDPTAYWVMHNLIR